MANTRNQTAVIQEVLALAEELAAMGGRLTESVSVFRVKDGARNSLIHFLTRS